VITEKTKVIVIDNPNATLLSATDSLCTGSSATVNVNVSDVKTAENWSLIYSINGVNQAAVTGRGPGNFNFTTPALTTIGNNVIRLVSVTNTSSTPNCSSTLTDSITVRVDDNTVAGTLTTNNNKGCYNSNSGTLTLAGNTGRVIRWESSEDNGQTWSTLSNSANTLDFLNLLRTTTYRVLVKNGACAAVYSNAVTITIIPEPMAVISGSPEVCTGTTAQFLVTVSNVANGESWSLTYTENGVTKTLTGTGSGTFTLTTGVLNYTSSPSTVTIDLQSVTNVTQGCTNGNLSSSAVGRITPRPVVSYTQSNECADSSANFASTSTIPEGSIVSYHWTFGDGNSSGNSNAINVYDNAGVYTVKLIATSDNGCKDSATSSITIFSNPVANFDLNNSCLNTDASFASTSTVVASPGASTINSYNWTFGDGRTSTTQNPTIRYNNSGTYDVSLTVSTNNGCTDVITKQITIYPVPNANFIASEPCENGAMNFTNTTNVDDGTSTYEWDFAGQGNSTDADPAFTFTGFGSFNVELIATSNFGCKDTFIRTVVVNPLPTADFSVADVCIGQASNFVNASSVPTGSITEHYWNLGDTTFDGLINPTHIYANAGTYNATLRVVTDKGCEASVTKPVVVNPLPVVVITPNGALDFCDGDSVSLTVSNGINTGLRSQNWSTGETTVSITAKTGGFYNVRITDLNGCENEDSIEVIVYANPIADAGRDTAIDKGASVQLDGSGGLTYSWTPTTYLDNPNIPNPLASRMEQTTTYVLTVVDINGCTDDDSVTVTVLDRFNLKVYNLVTPNGDGANDTWWIENIWAYPDAEVVIVNRYGMEVFRTTGYQNDWDGKYNGNELPDGAYYYIITVPGSDKVYKGAINLVRTN
jgi:gliding motility-associated-like protein